MHSANSRKSRTELNERFGTRPAAAFTPLSSLVISEKSVEFDDAYLKQDRTRRYGPSFDNPRARPFGFYPVVSWTAGTLEDPARQNEKKEGGEEKPDLISLLQEEGHAVSKPSHVKALEKSMPGISPIVYRPGLPSMIDPKFRRSIHAAKLSLSHQHLAHQKVDPSVRESVERAAKSFRFDFDSHTFKEFDIDDPEVEVGDVGIVFQAFVLRRYIARIASIPLHFTYSKISLSGIVELRVEAVQRFSAAWRSRRVQVGDVLVSINEEEVQGQPASLQLSKVRGPIGTYVVLGFCRARSFWAETCLNLIPRRRWNNAMASDGHYSVRLMRGFQAAEVDDRVELEVGERGRYKSTYLPFSLGPTLTCMPLTAFSVNSGNE
eukprot:753884-Hanusia_phi.AAC.1